MFNPFQDMKRQSKKSFFIVNLMKILVVIVPLFSIVFLTSSKSFSIESQIVTAESIQSQIEDTVLGLPGVLGTGIGVDKVSDDIGNVIDEVVFVFL